jgi:SAM-dependent methyltransferase
MLFELRSIAQNALLGITPLRRALYKHFAGSTGMNGSEDAVRVRFAFYTSELDVRGKDILELGPGHTPDVLGLAKTAGAGRCVGLDTETHATKRIAGVELLTYGGADMPFAGNTFDVVWCSDVMEHVRNPRKTTAEVARVLRPGGIFLATIDLRDHYFLHDEKRWLECLRYPQGLWFAMTSNRSSFVNRLRASEWRALFRDLAFEQVRFDQKRSDVLRTLYANGNIAVFGRDLGADDAEVFRLEVVMRKPALS